MRFLIRTWFTFGRMVESCESSLALIRKTFRVNAIANVGDAKAVVIACVVTVKRMLALIQMRLTCSPDLSSLSCPDCTHQIAVPWRLICNPERFSMFREAAENRHVAHRVRRFGVSHVNLHAQRLETARIALGGD